MRKKTSFSLLIALIGFFGETVCGDSSRAKMPSNFYAAATVGGSDSEGDLESQKNGFVTGPQVPLLNSAYLLAANKRRKKGAHEQDTRGAAAAAAPIPVVAPVVAAVVDRPNLLQRCGGRCLRVLDNLPNSLLPGSILFCTGFLVGACVIASTESGPDRCKCY